MALDGQKGIQSTFEGSTQQRFSPAQQALDQQLKGTRQFVMLQNTGDEDPNQKAGGDRHAFGGLSFLANPQTATVLAQNGVKNLAMSIRQEFQPFANKVARGEMTPAQYAQGKEDLYRAAGYEGILHTTRSIEEGKVIQSMARAGIRVLCKDNAAPNLKAHAEFTDRFDFMAGQYDRIFTKNLHLADIPKSIVGALKQKLSDATDGAVFPNVAQERQRHIDDIRIDAVSDLGGERATARELKEMIDGFIKGEKALAASIKRDVGKEKTAVFTGALYGAYEQDLDEALGKGTKKIALYASENRAKGIIQNNHSENMQQPQGAIALDTGKSFSAADIDGLIDKRALRMPMDLTPGLAKN